MNVYLTSTGPGKNGLYGWGQQTTAADGAVSGETRDYASALKVGSFQGQDVVSVATDEQNAAWLKAQPEYLAAGTLGLALDQAAVAKAVCTVEIQQGSGSAIVTVAEAEASKATQISPVMAPIEWLGEGAKA